MRMGAWEVVEKHTEGILSEVKRRAGGVELQEVLEKMYYIECCKSSLLILLRDEGDEFISGSGGGLHYGTLYLCNINHMRHMKHEHA